MQGNRFQPYGNNMGSNMGYRNQNYGGYGSQFGYGNNNYMQGGYGNNMQGGYGGNRFQLQPYGGNMGSNMGYRNQNYGGYGSQFGYGNNNNYGSYGRNMNYGYRNNGYGQNFGYRNENYMGGRTYDDTWERRKAAFANRRFNGGNGYTNLDYQYGSQFGVASLLRDASSGYGGYNNRISPYYQQNRAYSYGGMVMRA
jgi:hypothetical protein